MPRSSPFPAIPEPQKTLESHQETLLAIKEGMEVVTRQRTRQVQLHSCPTWAELIELGIVDADQANLIVRR